MNISFKKIIICLITTVIFVLLMIKISATDGDSSIMLEKRPIISVNYYHDSVSEEGKIKEDDLKRRRSVEILSTYYNNIEEALILFNEDTYQIGEITITFSTTKEKILPGLDFSLDNIEANLDVGKLALDDSIELFSQILPNSNNSIIISTAKEFKQEYIDVDINYHRYRAKHYFDNKYIVEAYDPGSITFVGITSTNSDIKLSDAIIVSEVDKLHIVNRDRVVNQEVFDDIFIDYLDRYKLTNLRSRYALVNVGEDYYLGAKNTANLTANNIEIHGYAYINDSGLYSSDLTASERVYLINVDGEYQAVKNLPLAKNMAVVVMSIVYAAIIFVIISGRKVLIMIESYRKKLFQIVNSILQSVKKRSSEIIIYLIAVLALLILNSSFFLSQFITFSVILGVATILFLVYFRFSLKMIYVMTAISLIFVSALTYLGAETISEKMGYIVFAFIILIIIRIFYDTKKKW